MFSSKYTAILGRTGGVQGTTGFENRFPVLRAGFPCDSSRFLRVYKYCNLVIRKMLNNRWRNDRRFFLQAVQLKVYGIKRKEELAERKRQRQEFVKNNQFQVAGM